MTSSVYDRHVAAVLINTRGISGIESKDFVQSKKFLRNLESIKLTHIGSRIDRLLIYNRCVRAI